ncbi:OadG family protein [Halarsenatibacter silvermanii]|uniref:Sodium pump decarboxylases, gamma subunit n=1 Tax=Halarsenatibacter silvermanii TaxID=321763 RepID=A0A1G9I8X1_9FIRM|nr:OadG family protein [Halarsenatibacter silvermanii]SDL21671.1 sodium pump decarboxylases, gamma subunit [Halarsenatibacter silvermanii]
MSLLELIQSAETLAEMSFGDKFLAGIQVAVLGMGIVFFILLLLMTAVKVIEFIAGSKTAEKPDEKTKKKRTGQAKDDDGELSPQRKAGPAESREISPQITAVITAALQSYYRDSEKKFRVLRVRKESRSVTSWMSADFYSDNFEYTGEQEVGRE